MKESDRQKTIEQFLAGELGPMEEQEFRRQMNSDPVLLRAVATEQAIQTALVADLHRIPADHTRLRSRLVQRAKVEATVSRSAFNTGSDGNGWPFRIKGVTLVAALFLSLLGVLIMTSGDVDVDTPVVHPVLTPNTNLPVLPALPAPMTVVPDSASDSLPLQQPAMEGESGRDRQKRQDTLAAHSRIEMTQPSAPAADSTDEPFIITNGRSRIGVQIDPVQKHP